MNVAKGEPPTRVISRRYCLRLRKTHTYFTLTLTVPRKIVFGLRKCCGAKVTTYNKKIVTSRGLETESRFSELPSDCCVGIFQGRRLDRLIENGHGTVLQFSTGGHTVCANPPRIRVTFRSG
jgi:hypothetical protein